MSHIRKILSVCFVLVVLTGCREKINHEIGIRQIVEKQDTTNTTVGKSWKKVDNTPGDVLTIEAFQGKLYLGGNIESDNDAFLYSYDGSNMSNVLKGTMISGPISDIETVGNRMWFGGSFSYHEFPNVYENLMYLENGKVSGTVFGDWLYSEIFGLKEYNGDLLVRGYFRKSSLHTGIKTSYLELVKGKTNVGFGTDVLTEPINEFAMFNNKLYITGEGNFTGSVHMCGYWNGTSWANSGFTTKSSILDNGFGIAEFKNNLYLTHNKTWATSSTLVQRFDGTKWYDMDNVDVSNDKRTHLRVIGDYLYYFGTGLLLDGGLESNILRYNGSKWEAVGSMFRTVVDVELYDGKLYAATDNGLYVLD